MILLLHMAMGHGGASSHIQLVLLLSVRVRIVMTNRCRTTKHVPDVWIIHLVGAEMFKREMILEK